MVSVPSMSHARADVAGAGEGAVAIVVAITEPAGAVRDTGRGRAADRVPSEGPISSPRLLPVVPA